MSCRRCGRALDADARFCASCGLPVGVPCAGCGAPLEAEARFCKHCGHAADASASVVLERLPGDPFVALRAPGSLARERKVATLLFADIVGFTSLGEGHDPEIVATLVAKDVKLYFKNRFFALITVCALRGLCLHLYFAFKSPTPASTESLPVSTPLPTATLQPASQT